MPTRRIAHLVLAALLFLCCGCSRGCSEPERPSVGGSPAASASVKPATSVPAGSETFVPVATPNPPPQVVACSGRVFFRITDASLEVFEASRTIPPPQIRGSAAAVQTASISVPEPQNVVALGDGRALVIAKQQVFSYRAGDKDGQARPSIQASGPLFVWPDPKQVDSFWLRRLGDKSLHHYALKADGGPIIHREQELAAFDGRLFTVLADGAPLYSTTSGLIRWGDESRPAQPPGLSEATLIFADPSKERYWVADTAGNLKLWDRTEGDAPVFTARVFGAVIDVAREGDRIAVLSMAKSARKYRPTVTIFSGGKQQAQQRIGESLASRPEPRLDVCLIADRPWVVVGSRSWLQVLDWSTPRLLAEW